MEPRTGLPSFWVTHLAKVLVGEQPCLLQPWLAGRFVLPKTSGSAIATWKSQHSELLQKIIAERQTDGWNCKVESFFRVPGQFAVVSGKADLILQSNKKLAHWRPRIIDAKSGKPKDSDTMQVLIEMVLIPMAWKAPALQFEGEVVYGNGNAIVLEPREAEALKPRLFSMIKQLATMERPRPAPSRDACMYCDVPDADCGERWKEDTDAVAVTKEF